MVEIARKIITNPDGGTATLFGELADAYQAEIEAHDAGACKHAKRELRIKILTGGGPMCKEQCLLCGAPVGNPVSKQPDLPKWDHGRHPEFLAARKADRDAILRKYVRLQASNDRQFTDSLEERRAKYQAYRRTPEWQAKRSKVMRRANGLCEGCLEAPATVVHHKTYANIGDELLFQLVALCRPCHARAHPEHNEPEFYDNDYLPCFQCRWGADGEHCGRFEVPTYLAIEANGECGPSFTSYEGLK